MFVEIVSLGAFVCLTLLVFLVVDFLSGGRRTARNLAAVQEDAGRMRRQSSETALSFKTALAGVLPQPRGEVEKIERDLKRAGYYYSTALLDYMSTRNGLIVTIILVTGVLAVIADPNTRIPQWILAGGALTIALGYTLPRLLLHWQASRRVERIHRGLPDALDIVRMCVTAGLPLREALNRVSQQIGFFHPDIAVEFEVIRRHADADTMPGALLQFARRIDTPDVNSLAALVSQSQQLGTHVALAITEYSDSVRLARKQRADERASKTTIKLLFPVVLCLAPPIYILMCGPPILKLKNFVNESRAPGGVLDIESSLSPLNGAATTPIEN
jgi:tight adherence protein C